ncbi:MAG: MarR family transcriptional regulator [Actinobacteria bacterium]|nr:MarR family transcriptional regulator [Actinomycetota bacterium]
MTRWLDTDQQRIWRSWLLGVARIDAVLTEYLRPHNLDLAEYEILVVLSESEQRRMRMSDLALLVHQSRSRLTHTVSRLENDGFVARERTCDDGRGVYATLTEAGFAKLVEAAPSHVESVRKIFVDAVAPEDYAAIGRAMSAVLAVETE